jgi:molybdenum cofactor synthesis domain-containing protein
MADTRSARSREADAHPEQPAPATGVRVAVLTVSDATSRGERADGSGDAAAGWASAIGGTVAARAVVSDDVVPIVRQLVEWCDADAADLVLTTGGTGLSPRDVTPEATRAAIEREAVGIAERLRAVTGATFPRAALSRGVAGVWNRTLIVNLPGSTSGVRDMLAALEPIVRHAIAIVRGEATEHSSPRAPR